MIGFRAWVYSSVCFARLLIEGVTFCDLVLWSFFVLRGRCFGGAAETRKLCRPAFAGRGARIRVGGVNLPLQTKFSDLISEKQ